MIFNNIGFIGAGKVGTSLAMYFKQCGLNVKGMYNKNQTSLQESCDFLKTTAFKNMEELVCSCDLIFITTPDHAIASVAENLETMKDLKGKYICHCSGSLSSEVLSNINNSGVHTYSLHPLWAFPDKFTSYKNLDKAYFSIEGSLETIHLITEFISSLGNKYFLLSKENKSLYHAATVNVSNFVLGLIKKGCDYFKLCGVEEKVAMEALMPLILNNIENFKLQGLPDSLSGPVERCDVNTVMYHLNSIPKEDLELYKSLSKTLIKIACAKNPNKDYSELEKIL
ncbi:Predicted oxidoreductase, contains short-chain dehydrogenase (SDR) and DUF2520 domains [Hathewaya proteolytica DSM 3090]|uniref:Predicted oxidoreductase, contains short-chain dehydrogenase (SDR) and DUF2520 domains n=1 Tax=Hathewaya proteolytica DSM 3090 TaxID=1121331 RepID=A0A1M6KPD8_9CLOT|nr:Rossmann-like and DUF2520 domain-containing protein [Hathewaya proteolytica]SHJ60771.1 Predicted oxidoreductase, contains short-chain dehydrogenase (SDR) and DUF2520 domains [Hathewaya proteolytica DSM 3090]